MAKRVDDSTLQYQADFWPRDHGKSEIFCLAYPLRLICEDPNIRILIVRKTATEAEKTVSVIKTELERNEELKAYYAPHWEETVGHRDISNATGTVEREGRREGAWQRRRIYVKRTRRGTDPTLEAVGVGGAITGGHYDVIILDDVEDDENTKTEARLRSLLEWLMGTIMQLREPHTKIAIVGTLKTAQPDIYNFVLNNPMWSCRVESAIKRPRLDNIHYDVIHNDEGRVVDVVVHNEEEIEVLWPAKWPIKALLLDMLASIRSIWIREKLNDLRALAGSIFKRTWFSYKPREELPRVFDQIVQAWDTAFEDTDAADWSVCVTVGLAAGKANILDVFRDKLEFWALPQAIKRQYTKWRPEVVLVEKKASGRSAIQVLQKETTLPIVAVKPDGKDKAAKARSITPFYESGRVVHVAGASWLDVFEDELTMFPKGAHDDQVDALVYALLRLFLEEIQQMSSAQIDWYAQTGAQVESAAPARTEDEIERLLEEAAVINER
jgi:predicted phage terminase large subunit-like protein